MKNIDLLKYGFKRHSDRDFEDDGTEFLGYIYKGLLITYAASYGKHYLSLRLDYLGYRPSDFKEDYNILHEFNGVDHIDIEKLISNCEYIVNKYKLSTLQTLRRQAGLSQAQLAIQAGVNFRMLQNYEQGAKDINKASVSTVYAIAKVLRCKIEDLIDFEGE